MSFYTDVGAEKAKIQKAVDEWQHLLFGLFTQVVTMIFPLLLCPIGD